MEIKALNHSILKARRGFDITIFSKLLKGTDLSFDFSLDKLVYTSGETINGVLAIATRRGTKVRRLTLIIEGKESTKISVTTNYGYSSSETYREDNFFFEVDLSYLLRNSLDIEISRDGILNVLPQNTKMPFNFSLPAKPWLLSSYKGKHAYVTYTIRAKAELMNMFDINKEITFSVINTVYNPLEILHKEDNIPSPLNALNSEEESTSLAVSQGSLAKSEKNILSRFSSTIDNTYRKYVLEHDPKVQIRFFKRGDIEDVIFSPSMPIKGEVIVLSNNPQLSNKIRSLRITLIGIEHSSAKVVKEISIIERLEKKIELKQHEFELCDAYTTIIPFDFEIPDTIRRSYSGKYSKYVWELEALVDIVKGSDSFTKRTIGII